MHGNGPTLNHLFHTRILASDYVQIPIAILAAMREAFARCTNVPEQADLGVTTLTLELTATDNKYRSLCNDSDEPDKTSTIRADLVYLSTFAERCEMSRVCHVPCDC